MSILDTLEKTYEIREKIHESGMESIFEIKHRLLDEIRAVRVILPDLDTDPLALARFHQEAKSSAALRHPNVVELYDFSVSSDGTAFVVMEFVDGRSLRQLRRTEPSLELDTLLSIGIQILEGIAYLHRAGYLHRNLSPEGIMVAGPETQPVVKIVDLGLMKNLQDAKQLTELGMFLGKPAYASPEQFGGADGEVDLLPESDIYSFGVLFYELLTGQLPVDGHDLASFAENHLFTAPRNFDKSDPTGRIPDPVRALVLEALEKEPEDRPGDARDLARRLRAIRQSLDASSRPDDQTVTLPLSSADVPEGVDVRATVIHPATPVLPNASPVSSSGAETAILPDVQEILEPPPDQEAHPTPDLIVTREITKPGPLDPTPSFGEATKPILVETDSQPSDSRFFSIFTYSFGLLLLVGGIWWFSSWLVPPMPERISAVVQSEPRTKANGLPPAGPAAQDSEQTRPGQKSRPEVPPETAKPSATTNTIRIVPTEVQPEDSPLPETVTDELPSAQLPSTGDTTKSPGIVEPQPPVADDTPEVPPPSEPRPPTVTDPNSGLTWLSSDTGQDIDWEMARTFCREYGDPSEGWRLPTISELRTLYNPTSQNRMKTTVDVEITDLGIVWADGTAQPGQAPYLAFTNGLVGEEARDVSERQRGLCVRGP